MRFTSGYSLDQYLADEKTRAAVERVLEICGEAMNNLHKVAPAIADGIPHSRTIVGFRNLLAHGYAELDDNKVHDIRDHVRAGAAGRRARSDERLPRSRGSLIVDATFHQTPREFCVTRFWTVIELEICNGRPSRVPLIVN
jgi:hypothetical protein